MNRRGEGEVSVEHNGKTYTGTWRTEKGLVTVTSFELGSQTTQIGGSPPESIARIMLGELVRGVEQRGKLK